MIGCLVNPLFLFLTVWGIAIILYLAGVSAGVFPGVEPVGVAMALLNVLTFALGYLTWSAFMGLRPAEDELRIAGGMSLTPARLRFSLRLTLAFGVIALLLCLGRLAVVAAIYNIRLPDLLSSPALWRGRLTAYVRDMAHQTTFTSIALSTASSLFSIGFVLLGIHLYFDRGWRRYLYAIAFFLVMVGIGILNLGRKEVSVNILFLVLSYLLMHQVHRLRTTREVSRVLLVPVVVVAFLYLAIELLLKKSQAFGPQGRITGFLFSLYWYAAAPLAAFGDFVANYDRSHSLGTSLFLPIYKWLIRSHLVAPSTRPFFGGKTYIPYMVNVYSYLKNVYEDFGVFGVAVVPYMLGWGTRAVQQRAHLLFSHLNLYMVLLVLIVFSFYNYLLISNQYYLQVFFAWAFFQFNLADLNGTMATRER